MKQLRRAAANVHATEQTARQRAKRGDQQGRSWEGRELTLGTWGGRRGGVPVEDKQGSGGESTMSRTDDGESGKSR